MDALDLLRNEITDQLAEVGTRHLPEVEKMEVGKFDDSVYLKTKKFLSGMRTVYANRSSVARKKLDAIVSQLTDSPEKQQRYDAFRLRYKNESVTSMVENSNETSRIVKYKGRLVQKLFPIYFKDHHPQTFFDFQAIFFVPTKYFIGRTFDTFYFNITVIWCMTIFFFITLYFDLLKKLVHGFETRRKYRKKNIG